MSEPDHEVIKSYEKRAAIFVGLVNKGISNSSGGRSGLAEDTKTYLISRLVCLQCTVAEEEASHAANVIRSVSQRAAQELNKRAAIFRKYLLKVMK